MNNEEFELLGEPRMTMAQFTLEEQLYGLEESDEPWDVEPSTKMHLADTPRDDHWRFVDITHYASGRDDVYISEWETNQSGELFCLRSHNYQRINGWSLGRIIEALHVDDWLDRPENIELQMTVADVFASAALKIDGMI